MEQEKQLTVSEMLKNTGKNTQLFMEQVADHITKLEEHIVALQKRVADLEANQNEPQ